MILFLTYDANQEAGLDFILTKWNEDKIEDFFAPMNYGSSLNDVSLFLICRNPDLNFKQRIRLSKKEKRLYIDLMFDLNILKKIKPLELKK